MSNESKLGTTPLGNEGRDAVHVAIMPVRAAEDLSGGYSVKLNADNEAEVCQLKDAIGVVDPFRPKNVAAGSWFWLCLYPKTITGLRHVWQHPSFPVDETPSASAPSSEKSASEQWLKGYVRKHCHYWSGEPDGGYSNFLNHVQLEREIFYYGSDCHGPEDVEDAESLYHHLSVVLGKRIDESYFHGFTCSC